MEADRERLKPEVFEHVWNGAPMVFRMQRRYYREEMLEAESGGRLLDKIHHDRQIACRYGLGLGYNDSTSITFAQFIGSEIRVIDFYESNGVGLDHYAQVMREKGPEHGYIYGTTVLPHDAKVEN